MPYDATAGTAEIVFLDRETLSPKTNLRAPDFPHRLTVYDRSRPGIPTLQHRFAGVQPESPELGLRVARVAVLGQHWPDTRLELVARIGGTQDGCAEKRSYRDSPA